MKLLRQKNRDNIEKEDLERRRKIESKLKKQHDRLERIGDIRNDSINMSMNDRIAEQRLQVKQEIAFVQAYDEKKDLLRKEYLEKKKYYTDIEQQKKLKLESDLELKKIKQERYKAREKEQKDKQLEEMTSRFRKLSEQKQIQEDRIHLYKQSSLDKKNQSPGKLRKFIEDLSNVKSKTNVENEEIQKKMEKIYEMKEKLAQEKAEKLKKSILDNQMKIYKIQKEQEMRTKERHMRMLAQTE